MTPSIKLLTDYSSLILPNPSPALVTKDVRRVASGLVRVAQKKGLVNTGNYAELVGNLVDFDLEAPNLTGCGGYIDVHKKRIAFQLDYSHADTQKVICHEMSHAIQMIAGRYDGHRLLLSEQINFEQEAESLACYLQSKLFPFNKPGYLTYFNGVSDYQFLANWYGDFCQNDLYEEAK